MRTLRLAFVVSAGVHAVVVVWLASRRPAPRGVAQAPPGTPIEIEIATVGPSPAGLDVALIEAPPPGGPGRAPAAAPLASRGAAPRAPGIDAARPGAPPGPPGAVEHAPAHGPGRNPLLAMRRGEAPSAALPFGRWDSLDHAPRGTSPERVRTTGMLHESGGGSYRSDQGVFEVRVDPDGSVAITDRPNLQVHLALPSPRDIGRAAASWYTSDKGRFGKEGDTTMAGQIQVSSAATSAVGGPESTWATEPGTTVVIPVLGGGFDVTDWLMRGRGQDPYGARKRALLDATRDERVQIGSHHRAAELARAPELVHRNLEALWARTADLGERKRGLFELWDDCAETGDPAVVAAGEAARRMIIGFIRARLPAGSAGAYTAAEIAALARTQRSKAAFQPYE